MALYNFHRVLIAASILFDVFFTTYCFTNYTETAGSMQPVFGVPTYVVLGVGSSVLTVAFIAYLFWFQKKTTLLLHAVSGTCSSCRADLRRAIGAGQTACPNCGAPIPRLTIERATA